MLPVRWAASISRTMTAVFWIICTPACAESAAGGSRGLGTEDQCRVTESLLARCGVPLTALNRLRSALKDLTSLGFEYPWNGLEEAVAAMPTKKLLLLGYGSLLNQESAARTIKDVPADNFRPVLAVGAFRVFNYVIPTSRLQLDGANSGRERAALNVVYTKSPAHLVNGRLVMVGLGDLDALREREFGYDLRPVLCMQWSDWDSAPFIAYILVAVHPSVDGRRVTDDSILPHPAYARTCRAGANAVSEEFLELYLNTTYLSDRKTSLAVWERIHPELIRDPHSD